MHNIFVVDIMVKIKKKAIMVDEETYEILNGKRNYLGGTISFNMVVQSLLADTVKLDLANVKIDKIEEEMVKLRDETYIYMQKILELSLENSQTVVATAMPQQTIPIPSSPPPPFKGPPKRMKKSTYKPKMTGNTKKDFVNEMKQVFNGEYIKPSELLKITKPKHKDVEVKVLDEDFEEPDIFDKSTAINFKNELMNQIKEVAK